MKQKYHLIILLVAASVFLSGCKKFLTVQPEASYTEDQVFSSETAVQQALNGLYGSMADNSLYGANLTTTTIELMAQRWNNGSYSSDNNYNLFQTYDYSDAGAQDVFSTIWTNTYSNILAANKFISKIDGTVQSGVLTQAKANELKGEAIAIRAFMHFDMLRLFGPIYSVSADQQAIPYYRYADGNSQPIISARQALDSVLDDYTQAETLLANDPVVTSGVVNSQDFYAGNRSQRLNYYAVKGLMARAYLWGGDSAVALDSAKATLAQGEKWFPWMNYSDIVSNSEPDRIFYPEVLFGVYNQEMYNDYTAYFSQDLTTVDVLAPLPARLSGVFESNENDYRYETTWTPVSAGYSTFDKYKDIGDVTKPWRFIQPLLRKSEMYYIIAETDPSTTEAFAAMDSVRYHRGLENLDPSAVLSTEIKKEYQKEFWGEGQLFFYYKRTNATSIPSATVSYLNVGMSASTYVVPLPLSETSPR